MLPLGCGAWTGLALRDELKGYSSSGMGSRSGWKAGNLKVALGLESRPEIEAMARGRGGVVEEEGRGLVGYAIWGRKGAMFRDCSTWPCASDSAR